MTNQESRPPLPPFTLETATQKVRLAADGWNSRNPRQVSLAYSAQSRWRNRSTFVTGFAYFVDTGLLNQEMIGYADLDASINFNITKNVQLALQGVNLTDALRYQVFGSKQFPSNIFLDGRQLMASVTLRF